MPSQSKALCNSTETLPTTPNSIAPSTTPSDQGLFSSISEEMAPASQPSIQGPVREKDVLSTRNILRGCHKGRLQPPAQTTPKRWLLTMQRGCQKLPKEGATSRMPLPEFVTMQQVQRHLREQYKKGQRLSCTHATPWQSAFISKDANRERRFRGGATREA